MTERVEAPSPALDQAIVNFKGYIWPQIMIIYDKKQILARKSYDKLFPQPAGGGQDAPRTSTTTTTRIFWFLLQLIRRAKVTRCLHLMKSQA